MEGSEPPTPNNQLQGQIEDANVTRCRKMMCECIELSDERVTLANQPSGSWYVAIHQGLQD